MCDFCVWNRVYNVSREPKFCEMPRLRDNTRKTPVQGLLTGAHVFLTGATGFFGKMLIDKLFRTAPEIAGLYLMVRPKKGKDVEHRLEELFSDPVFDRLREEVPDFRKRVFPVEGDCSQPGLGISEHNLLVITSKVNVVFHAAATVKFDENIKIALEINVKGTEALLELCKKCTRLKVRYISPRNITS